MHDVGSLLVLNASFVYTFLSYAACSIKFSLALLYNLIICFWLVQWGMSLLVQTPFRQFKFFHI